MKIYKIPEPALLHLYQNGNYDVKIYSDGTKVRTTEDDEFIAQFPENIDCKITNKCDMGCAFCHENSVIHTIAGIHNLEPLVSKELKVLILGYKSIRRGKDFINCHGMTIRKKIAELEAKIPEYLESFKVLSFDNLALEQLNIKKYVSPEDWKAHYMGDDGSFTMYIDLVKEEFAKNSTSVNRYNLNDYKSIEEIFNKIKN